MDDSFVSPSTTVTQTIGGNVNAYGVQIRFQATDLVRPTTTDNTSNRPDQSSSEPTSSGPAPTNTSSPGLSTGAKAGIGVGAAVAGLVFLVALFLGWRYVKKRRTGIAANNRGGLTYGDTEPKPGPVEGDFSEPQETYGGAGHNELHKTEPEQERSELPERSEVRWHELNAS